MEQNWLFCDQIRPDLVTTKPDNRWCQATVLAVIGILEFLNCLKMQRKLELMNFLAGTFLFVAIVSVPIWLYYAFLLVFIDIQIHQSPSSCWIDHLDCTLLGSSCDLTYPKLPPMHLLIYVTFALCSSDELPVSGGSGVYPCLCYTFTNPRLS